MKIIVLSDEAKNLLTAAAGIILMFLGGGAVAVFALFALIGMQHSAIGAAIICAAGGLAALFVALIGIRLFLRAGNAE